MRRDINDIYIDGLIGLTSGSGYLIIISSRIATKTDSRIRMSGRIMPEVMPCIEIAIISLIEIKEIATASITSVRKSRRTAEAVPVDALICVKAVAKIVRDIYVSRTD